MYSRVDRDFHDTYLCKCGKAWEVTRGSRRFAGGDTLYFTKYKKVDPAPIKQFKADVAKDAETL